MHGGWLTSNSDRSGTFVCSTIVLDDYLHETLEASMFRGGSLNKLGQDYDIEGYMLCHTVDPVDASYIKGSNPGIL